MIEWVMRLVEESTLPALRTLERINFAHRLRSAMNDDDAVFICRNS
jgi:hypothetical protein